MSGSRRHGRGVVGRVARCSAVAAVAVALSACTDGDGATPDEREPVPTVAAPPTTTSGATGPEEATRTGGAPVAPAQEASAETPALAFVADTNADVSTERDGNPVLVSVTKGDHDTYVRYVFRFNHSDPDGHQPWRRFARPPWDVRYVPQSEAVQDGSGDPVANVGSEAHLRIRFEANMHDGAEGQNTLQTSVSDTDALDFGSDYEGRVTWFYGSRSERPFRVFYVGDGRVAVDIVT